MRVGIQRAQQRVRAGNGRASWWVRHRRKLASGIVICAHVLGALTSVRAVMDTRTSQGAIAWAVSLNTFPYVAVPAYWILGRSEFNGYVVARRSGLTATGDFEDRLTERIRANRLRDESENETERLLEKLAQLPWMAGNQVQLLIDGEATFDAMYRAIEAAESYVLFQFFIVRDDVLGNKFRELLQAKASAGVQVYFLYDEVGCYQLSANFFRQLESSGARVAAFNTTQGQANRFQINFRNHRKIVVVDGQQAFVGGLNVGDEYVNGGEFASWRDTHTQLRGPIVQAVQVPFAEDWFWATKEILQELNWEPAAVPGGDTTVLCLPTGPADLFETCTMFFLAAINQATERLWIASPYFVPDEAVMKALQMAALRGVDVRILLPNDPDHQLVYLSSFSYLEDAERAGVEIYRYQPGFLHQKVVLVDREYAAVGTANLDNRSFRLNFEIMMLFEDTEFNREVATMLEDDFSSSRRVNAKEYTQSSFPFRLAVRAARLLAPVQ